MQLYHHTYCHKQQEIRTDSDSRENKPQAIQVPLCGLRSES